MIQVVIFDFWGVLYNPRTGDTMVGLESFLEELSKREIKCGIASSSIERDIQEFLKNQPYADAFDVIVGLHEVQQTKPDPECYLKVAEYFEMPATNCLVIDDSLNAIQAAEHAGFMTLYFGNKISTFQDIDLDTFLANTL